MISRLRGNGFSLVFSFKSLYHYSKNLSSAAQPQTHFLADYLVKSVGFSNEEALSAIKKVAAYKSSRKDPDLVLKFFEKLGLNKSQIKSIIFVEPRFLLYDADKTLQPKVQLLQDVGLSGPDLVRVLMNYKTLLRTGFSQIAPLIEYLRKILGNDEKVATVLKKFSPLLTVFRIKNMVANVELLRKAGFSDENVSRFIVNNPRHAIGNPERLDHILHRLENEFEIPRESKMFYHGVVVMSSLSQSAIDLKFKVLRSFGWSDANIHRLFRNQPYAFRKSNDKVRKISIFFMDELGYTPDYLVCHPVIFNLNLENRVKPRTEVFKILNENGLNKRKLCLYTVLCWKDSKFIKNYLLPHKDKIPDVYDSYMKNRGRHDQN